MSVCFNANFSFGLYRFYNLFFIHPFLFSFHHISFFNYLILFFWLSLSSLLSNEFPPLSFNFMKYIYTFLFVSFSLPVFSLCPWTNAWENSPQSIYAQFYQQFYPTFHLYGLNLPSDYQVTLLSLRSQDS